MITLINHQGLKVMAGLQLQSPSPSIGLAYIGAYLKKNGLTYTAIDACGMAMDQIRPYPNLKNVFVQGLTNDEIIEKIPEETKIIGFTCLFSHCWPLVNDTLQAAKKKFPNALFVLGGEHGTALPELCLKEGFDVIVTGEGEETFLELCKLHLAGEDWSQINGVAYLNKEGKLQNNPARKRVTDVDAFPHPDWDEWCIEEYISHNQVTGINLGRSAPILGSRGCPYACKFCSNPGMWTRRYIMRSPEGLVNEMEEMKNKYNLSGFTFMDSTFIVNRKKTLDFTNELINRNLNVSYQLPAGTRCEAFDTELAHKLDQSGLRNFAFAPESGSEEILKVIKKQVSMEGLLAAARTVMKTKMTIGCFIVIGFPEDTPSTLRETVHLLRKLALLGIHDVTVSKFTPYPGSVYFDELESEGKVRPDMNDLGKVINFYSDSHESHCRVIGSKKLHHWMLWMYLNFYVLSFIARPWRPFMNLVYFFTKKGYESTRYMRLFNELIFNRGKWMKRKESTTKA